MKRLTPFLLLLPLALFAGCSHANKKPKASSAVASEIEEGFKQRWVEKRASDLMALGLRADLARTQALKEFSTKFSATHAADK
ncbi:MAG: hypothetical protein ABI222_09540 [Opitutaceae bacterium]